MGIEGAREERRVGEVSSVPGPDNNRLLL